MALTTTPGEIGSLLLSKEEEKKTKIFASVAQHSKLNMARLLFSSEGGSI